MLLTFAWVLHSFCGRNFQRISHIIWQKRNCLFYFKLFLYLSLGMNGRQKQHTHTHTQFNPNGTGHRIYTILYPMPLLIILNGRTTSTESTAQREWNEPKEKKEEKNSVYHLNLGKGSNLLKCFLPVDLVGYMSHQLHTSDLLVFFISYIVHHFFL